MELIPGLSDDLARECLIRVPSKFFPSLLSVCKAWNHEIQSPDFHRRRRQSGLTRPVFILADNRNANQLIGLRRLIFRLLKFDPESGSLAYLPPAPPLPPKFSSYSITGIVGVGFTAIVVLFAVIRDGGGSVNLVYLFDFLTAQWRRGADLPGPARLAVALAGDPLRRRVLVAGGYIYDEEKARSAFLYDVATDTWLQLDDMEKHRFEGSVVFHRRRFHVVSGIVDAPLELKPSCILMASEKSYCRYRWIIESPSRARLVMRMTCAESLDPVTLQWGPIDNQFLEASASEYHFVMENGEGDLYQLGQNVMFRRGGAGEWRPLAELPKELSYIMCAMTWRNKMVVIGRLRKAYVLDLNTCEWTAHDIPYESLSVGCGMDL